MNSWTPILQQLEKMTGNRPKLFTITNLCVKIIAITWNSLVASLAATFLSLTFDSLPVYLYPTFTGILPENNLPNMFWQIVFFPLELMTMLLPMIGLAFNLCVIAIGIEVFRIYNNAMR